MVKTQRLSPEVFGARSALTYVGDIDGVRSLGAIVERQGDRGNAARLLYLLVACDLIRLG